MTSVLIPYIEEVPFVDFVIPTDQIRHDSGHCYLFVFRTHAGKLYARVGRSSQFLILEDGKALSNQEAPHDDIRALGGGRNSLWEGQIYFSSLDNSDPRKNGKSYTVRVPAFVHFVEKLPESGIRKFGV